NKYIVAIAPIIKITSIINAGIYSVLSSGKYKKSINIITVTSFFKYHINLFHIHCFKRHKLLYAHINCKYSISNLNHNDNHTLYDSQKCSFFATILIRIKGGIIMFNVQIVDIVKKNYYSG